VTARDGSRTTLIYKEESTDEQRVNDDTPTIMIVRLAHSHAYYTRITRREKNGGGMDDGWSLQDVFTR